MNEQILITPYTEDDRKAVIEGNIDLQETERAVSEFCLPGEEIGELYLNHLLALNREQFGTLLVAKIGDKTVGFISCRIDHDDSVTTTDEMNTYGYISDAWTHPEYRNRGIFKELEKAALEYLRSLRKVSIVKLNVIAKNTPAVVTYENTGYETKELMMMKRL